MEKLLDRIHESEKRYLSKGVEIVSNIFNGVYLPSHDLYHHLRVWLYCRGLLIELHKLDIPIPDRLIDQALLASLFHDTGLSQNTGEKHGATGAMLFHKYSNLLPSLTVESIDAISHAIELHDNKSLKQNHSTTPEDMTRLDRLISTADDLDAWGTMGVFRYIEIYLKRKISPNELPRKVITNLKNRFTNFALSYSPLLQFVNRQRIRYQDTLDFFTMLDADMTNSNRSAESAYAIVEFINDSVVNREVSFETLFELAKTSFNASYPLCFFNKLRNEHEITSALILNYD